ncbi:MAG: hypothetical protein IPG50_30770 [Myxococcales bacterium]|nr:hypothetical protein [Myxococcales bacterium]
MVINGDGGSATEAGDATSSPIDATTDAIGESDASSVVATVGSFFRADGRCWGTPIPLDQFWGVSPNAPPARGIASVLQISVFDRLIGLGPTNGDALPARGRSGCRLPGRSQSVFSTSLASFPHRPTTCGIGTGGATKVGILAHAQESHGRPL